MNQSSTTVENSTRKKVGYSEANAIRRGRTARCVFSAHGEGRKHCGPVVTEIEKQPFCERHALILRSIVAKEGRGASNAL